MYAQIKFIQKLWKECVPYLSNLLFGMSARVHLKDCATLEDFCAVFSSKKRRDFKRLLRKDCAKFRAVAGQFRIKYILLLWKFINIKYKHYHVVQRCAQWLLGVAFMCTGILQFVEYYRAESDSEQQPCSEMCGWSSYFVHNDVMYDFISAPVHVPISVIGIHSIIRCLQTSVPILDMGPTQLDLKQRKFGCVLYDALNREYC